MPEETVSPEVQEALEELRHAAAALADALNHVDEADALPLRDGFDAMVDELLL